MPAHCRHTRRRERNGTDNVDDGVNDHEERNFFDAPSLLFCVVPVANPNDEDGIDGGVNKHIAEFEDKNPKVVEPQTEVLEIVVYPALCRC